MTEIPTRKLGTLNVPPIINGLWQIANGSLTRDVTIDEMVSCMMEYSFKSLNAFDGADHYGPSEIIMGKHKIKTKNGGIYFTKYVPEMNNEISFKITEKAIQRSLDRLQTDSIDLIQFHYWNYNDKDSYIDILKHLMILQKQGKIKNIGLTNFNTHNLKYIIDTIPDINIVSNQLPYSIIDTRIENNMIPYCQKHNIGILTYGTVLGGFLSAKYLPKHNNKPKSRKDLHNVSLRRYYKIIMLWCNNKWELFEELLLKLHEIGLKYNKTLTQIGIKYILDKPCVIGCIIGCRLGISNHINDTIGLFDFKLSSKDITSINNIVKKGRKLKGEPADEHRGAKL